MSERPWTPGPWTYGVRKNGSIWVSLGDPTNERSAHYQCDFPVREPDARLATCAPELYEALNLSRSALEIYGSAKLLKQIDAALAKAKGQE